MLEDLRDALRRLGRRPGPPLVAALVLALGTGASTSVFSVVDGVLLRPLPWPEPERLVRVYESNPELGRDADNPSPINLLDWSVSAASFEHLAGSYARPTTLRGDGPPESIDVAHVTPAFFSVLGARPAAGRLFGPDAPGASFDGASRYTAGERDAVLSYGLWQRRFGGSPDVIGASVSIERVSWRVIGIAPEGLDLPASGVDAWLPWDIAGTYARLDLSGGAGRDWRFLHAIGRLAPGASLASARAEMQTLAADLAARYPQPNGGWSVRLEPLHESLVGHARPGLLVLLAAVGCVLLIACSNAAGLQLAAASERERELAVRSALGATPQRLLRSLLVEGLALGLAGGGAGLLLARGVVALLHRLQPEALPRLAGVGVDLRASLVGLCAALAAGLVAAWLPARQLSRRDTAAGLREGGRGSAGASRGRLRLRRLLVSGQAALALLLLAGALLFTRSFLQLVAVDPGFDSERLLVARMRVESAAADFYRALIERLEALPGVRAAGAVTALPMSEVGPDFDRPYWREGEQRLERTARLADIRMATPGYFDALGLPLLSGRRFDQRDVRGAPRVLAISRELARREWPSESPLGRQLVIDYLGGEYPYEVVAVVGDTRFHGLRSQPRPELYIPHAQNAYLEMNVALRTRGEPGEQAEAFRAAVAELDPEQAVHSTVTMDQLLARSAAPDRLAALLLAALAGLAVALAATGLYALQAFLVSRRGAELGVRMALGARRRDIAGLVLGDALGTALPGAAIGLLLALALARAVRGLLFGVAPSDPLALGGAALGLIAIALLAAAIPAGRACGVDPSRALRDE